MINSGPGASASEPQTTYWQSLTRELTEVDETLNTKLKDIGATWEGQAAESAQSGLTPLAEWASDAQTGSTVMQTSSELQADYVSDARSNMPEPVKVTTPAPSGWQMAAAGASMLTGNPGPAAMVAVQAADHEAQESAQNEAEQQAVQTMQTYESSSTWNRDTLGTFVPPPDVVVSSPPPQGGTGTSVEGPQTASGANASGSTQSTTASGFTVPTTGNGGPTGTGGGFVPGGTSTPPTTVPAGPGPGPGLIPAATTPAGLAPPLPGQPPVGTPPLQPGPGLGNPPVTPAGPGLNNPLLPGLSNTGQPLPGGTGPVNTGGNRGPIVGRGPGQLPAGTPNVPVNAGDAARRAAPIRGGLPPVGGAGGFQPDNTRGGSQYGRPGVGGAGAVPGQSAVRNGPGAAAAAGGRGAAGIGPRGVAGVGGAGNGVAGPVNGRGGVGGAMGAGGRRGERENDDEHFAPDYLLETEDVFGDDRRIVPGVIGETAPQD
jgi:hypothetical protein